MKLTNKDTNSIHALGPAQLGKRQTFQHAKMERRKGGRFRRRHSIVSVRAPALPCTCRSHFALLCLRFAVTLACSCTEMKSRERRSQPDRRADGRTDEGEEGSNLERSKTRQGGRNERIGEIIRAQRCFLLKAFLFPFLLCGHSSLRHGVHGVRRVCSSSSAFMLI